MATDPEEQTTEENPRIVLHEGYIHKKGQINRSWKKRYFILYNDKKLAYYTAKEVTHQAPINEINLSTVKELSLLQYSNRPKSERNKRTKSFTEIFTKTTGKFNHSGGNLLNLRNTSNDDPDDSESDDDENDVNDDMKYVQHTQALNENDDEYQMNDIFVDAPINNRSFCSHKFAFDLVTDKRSYWLHCNNVNELSEWIIHLKYAVFGKLMFDGYLTKKYKKNLKTKWKRRYIEVYESKIIRIYKNNKKRKVKEQIDLDFNNVSCIKYGTDQISKTNDGNITYSNIIQIYDNDHNLQHIFSAESKHLRDEVMESLHVTMQAQRLNILKEGFLHFRADEVKCWKFAYFALISGSLIQFKSDDKAFVDDFKNSIYTNDDFYNLAFNKYVQKSMPMIDPKIEKKEFAQIDTTNLYKYSAPDSLLEKLKIFTVTTTIGKWYFGAEEATDFLSWCQSFHRYCSNKSSPQTGPNRNSIHFTVSKNTANSFERKPSMQRIFSTSDDEDLKININVHDVNAVLKQKGKAKSVEIDDLVKFNIDEHNDDLHELCTDIIKKRQSGLNGKAVMAVNLKRARTLRDTRSQSQTVKTHFGGSRSLQLMATDLRLLKLKESATEELMEDGDGFLNDEQDMDNDIDSSQNQSNDTNEVKKELDTLHDAISDEGDDIEETEYKGYVEEDGIYSSDSDDDDDRDCLEMTMTENDRREHTVTNFILDDLY